MRIAIKLALAALAAMGITMLAPAYAADKGGPKIANIFDDAPVGPSKYNWTGCYAGGGIQKMSASTDIGFGADGYGMGLLGGCDVQLGVLVLGAFGDYDWKHVTQFGGVNLREWSFGGRAGVTLSNATLIYALVSRPTLNVNTFNVSTTGIGVGGGIETMITPHIAIGLEYRHNDWSNLAPAPVNAREDVVGVRLTARVNFFSGK